MLLMRGHGDLHYAAFDLLWLNCRDLRSKPLTERKRRLERLIPESGSLVSRVLTVPEDGRAVRSGAAPGSRGDGSEAEGRFVPGGRLGARSGNWHTLR